MRRFLLQFVYGKHPDIDHHFEARLKKDAFR
jgi:hypothetical protein